MRKTIFVRTLCCGVSFFCLAALGPACLPLFSQDAPAALPSDPKELMLLAAKTNGLTGDDVKPWHLKATYKVLDEQGNATDQGTYEEFWVSPTKYKRSFTSSAFSRTYYGTQNGTLQTGDQVSSPWQLDMLRRDLVGPMPSEKIMATRELEDVPKEGDSNAPRCVTMKIRPIAPATPQDNYGTFCFDPHKAVLLSVGYQSSEQTHFRNSVSFQGHFLPGDLDMSIKGHVVLTAHLESYETLDKVDEAALAPPPDATTFREIKMVGVKGAGPAPGSIFLPLDGEFMISSDVAVGLLTTKIPPVYPPVAKAARVQGTVVLQALLGKDGHVKQLHVISGPPMLLQAAMDAVKQWVYKPYLVNGKPTEVQTTVNIIFALGDKPLPNQMPQPPTAP